MTAASTKHPCPDCRYCQWCSDDRCRLCRRGSAGDTRKLSMAEQIHRYEEVNRSCLCGITSPAAPRAKT